MLKRAALAALLASTAMSAAHARVEVPTKAVMAMGFGNAIEFADGYKWNQNTLTAAEAEAAVRLQIDDAHAMGVRVFLFDATSNSAALVWRLARWNAAARAFNTANPGDKVCLSPMYESAAAGNGTTDGALPLFDAADAGGSASPLCTISSRPVVATWGNGTCINPLPAISARGPFSVISTTFNNGINHSDAACVSALKGAGATTVHSYLWASGNSAFSVEATVNSKKADILATGADEFIMGIGSARAEGCGEGGNGPKTNDYRLTDLKFWQHYLEGWRIGLGNANRVMLTMAASGDLGENSYISSSRVCDPRDTTNHSVESGGITRGFTCPNVPDDFTAAMPAAFQKSTSMPLWSREGFWRAQQVWGDWLRSGTEPDADAPFIAYAYRQHKWGLAGSWGVCPSGTYVVTPASVGGAFQGDHIALTSWSDVPVRVQVELAGATIYDGTLPAKQMKLAGDSKQVLVPIGDRVGRPLIKVLNDAGDVIASKQAALKITTTPRHWGGKLGRNPGLHAGYLDFSAGAGWSGIRLGSTGNARNNLVRTVAGKGILTADRADNVDIAGNTIVSTTVGVSVGAAAGSGLGRSMAVANNIIAAASTGISTSGDIGADTVYPNNLFHDVATPMIGSVAAVAAGTITADPKFVSASDWHLQSSSPARDAGLPSFNTGVDRDGRSRGSTPDIGAFEFFDPAARSPCAAPDEPPPDPDPEPDAGACIPPPTLVSPQVHVVGAGGKSITLGENQDAMVTCNAVVKTSIKVFGGRNVHIKGCEIVQDWTNTPSGETRALGIMGTKNTYIEGLLIDAGDRCDIITVQPNHNTQIPWINDFITVTVVNTWGGNNNYNKIGTCHGDCFQTQGHFQERDGKGGVKMNFDRFSCMMKGQGIFVPDRSKNSTGFSANIKRTNIYWGVNGVPRYDVFKYPSGNTMMYFFGSASTDTKKWPVTLGEGVYMDWRAGDRNISPGAATGTQAFVDLTDPNKIRFTPNSLIAGEILKGIPPGGDWAPRNKVGMNYNRATFCTN